MDIVRNLLVNAEIRRLKVKISMEEIHELSSDNDNLKSKLKLKTSLLNKIWKNKKAEKSTKQKKRTLKKKKARKNPVFGLEKKTRTNYIRRKERK